MNENDTRVNCSIQIEETDNFIEFVGLNMIVNMSLALTVVTLIYGVVSWCVLKKFRYYRNFVILNAILANFLLFVMLMCLRFITQHCSRANLPYMLFVILTMFLTLYLGSVKLYWLIAISHMFYVDIVKVFYGHIQRRYLKCSLFGWGVPLLTSLIYPFVITAAPNLNASEVIFYSFVLPMVLNSLLYIVIVYKLCRGSEASPHTGIGKRRRMYIATLIFILSDGFIFSSHIMWFVKPNSITIFLANMLNFLINPLILTFHLVFAKTNLEIWHEFYVKKIKERESKRDIKMSIKSAVINVSVINIVE